MTISSGEETQVPTDPDGDAPPLTPHTRTDAGGTDGPGGGGAPTKDRYPWIAMTVVLIGTFMVILDTTIVNVALPQIGIALGNADSVEWIVTAYLLAVGVGLPATGWLADKYGRKQIFILSLSIFTLSSLLAALSPNLTVLVGVRVVQGLGGGALMPVGMAMIYELFPPHRRGTALGVWGVAAMAGPAFGPVIGGYLVTSLSWHWLFLVNVPIGIVGVTLAIILLRDTGFREDRPFDGPGLALAATGLAAWLYAFSSASSWGWLSAEMFVFMGGGGILLFLFVRRALRIAHPLIELRMFTVFVFNLTIFIGWAVVVLQYSRMVFLPLELETLRNMTALAVGVLFIPSAAAAALSFYVGGRITDRIGPKFPVMFGAVVLTIAALILGTLSLTSPIWVVLVGMIVQGFGSGFALMPVAVTGMNALPRPLRRPGVRGAHAQPAGGGLVRGGGAGVDRGHPDGRAVGRVDARPPAPHRPARLQLGVPHRRRRHGHRLLPGPDAPEPGAEQGAARRPGGGGRGARRGRASRRGRVGLSPRRCPATQGGLR